MKKLKITTIIFLAGAAMCLCAILIILLFSGRSIHIWEGGSNYTLVLEKEIAAESVRSLKIEYGANSNDVYFYQGTGDTVIIREYMNFAPRENQLSAVVQEGKELSIKGSGRNSFFFFSFRPKNAYTEIYLPAGIAENLDELYVKTLSGNIYSDISFVQRDSFYASSTSGDISFPEVRADEIRFHSTSGEIRLDKAEGHTFSASTTSGDITAEQVAGEATVSSTSGEIRLERQEGDIEASTTSGDITLKQVTGEATISSTSGEVRLGRQEGDIEASTTSGDIKIENLQGRFEMDSTSGTVCVADGTGQGKVKTISGDVQVFLAELTGDMNVSTTSGYVDLKFPETASFTLDFDSTSGECSTFFDDRLSFNKKGNKAQGQYGSGAQSVRISTTSGDLRISQY